MSKRSPSPHDRRGGRYNSRSEGRTREYEGEKRYRNPRDDRYERRDGPSRSNRPRSHSRDNGYSRPRDRRHDTGHRNNGERRGDSGWGSRAQPSSGRHQPIKRERSISRSRSRSPPRKRKRSTSRDAPSGRELIKRPTHYDDDSDRHGDRRVARRERSEDAQSDRGRSASRLSDEGKFKPDFKNSGLLAAATNTVHRSDGTKTVLKYNEPPEARKPTEHWRLYDFDGENEPVALAIYKQSVFLFGRDAAVVDIPLNHPSCSKQHAAIQFRHVIEKNEFGDKKGVIKPFVIDLESTNGTHVNGETIPTARYYELKLNDGIKFGTSDREFVLLHEDAAA